MAPSKAAQAAAPPYTKDERVLCFHHEMLYEAKVLDTRPTEDETSWQYKIHYKGWKNTWDDWVPHDRVRKFTDENKELAAQLHQQMKQLQKAPKGSKGAKGSKANGGSEIGSSRGSEERHASAAAPGRGGPRRNRDYDLEQVSAAEREQIITQIKASQSHGPRQRPESLKQGTKRTYNDFDADIPKPTRRSAKSPVTSIPFDEGHGTAPRKSARLCRDSNDWSDPKSGMFDTLRVLCSDECLAPDPLLRMPPKNFEYIDASGKLKNPYKYHTQKPQPEPHPKLAAHIKNGTATPVRELYYKDMPHDLVLPFGGIIHNERLIVKDSVVREVRAVREEAVYKTRLCRALHHTESDIEESALLNMKSKKRSLQNRAERTFTREWLTFFKTQEEGFHSRPSIKLLIPDHIKALLVDDWENVTKNQTLVPVPSAHPVNKILNDYLDYEMPKRQPGSAQADILEEVVAGLKEYFEKCLGRILLYRFERNQYLEVRDLWTKGEGEWAGKGAGDTYGAEHLCRLLVSLPELIAQTNMDQQSVNRLREELSKMTNWLGKLDRLEKYFVKEYETPTQDYVEKARAV